MTRGTAVARARAIYNEDSSDYITDAFLQNCYNDVQREVAIETLCYPVSTTTNLAADTRLVILPAGMFAIRRGGVSTTVYHPLTGPVSLDRLIAEDLNWATTEGTVDRWYIAEQTTTVSSVVNWAIGLYPLPTASITSGITIRGFGIPADTDDDNDLPPWPTPYHDVMIWGMCYYAALRDTDMKMSNARVIGYFEGRYQRAKDQLAAAAAQGFADRVRTRGGNAEVGTGAEDVIRLTMTVS